MTNQPDPAKFLAAGERIQDLIAEMAGKAQIMQDVDEQAMIEFGGEGITPETCAAGLALYKDMVKSAAELLFRCSAHEAKAWFYLPEGASEGDLPPCDC